MSRPDELDDLIREIQEDPATRLSAEMRNQLHAALSSHPWCSGKALRQRLLETAAAIAQGTMDASYRHRLERMRKRAGG